MSSSAIYLVANKRSQADCANLVYSIRSSGCTLDIVLLPFGGDPVDQSDLLSEVKVFALGTFPPKAHHFINALQEVLQCPQGYLRRFYAFFGPYERFIYSDNDVVALSDWTSLIDVLDDYDYVHADNEYLTNSVWNFRDPSLLENYFGPLAHQSAMTAGHFAAKQSPIFAESFALALEWMTRNSEGCILHDQTLMQVASLIGSWKCLNLCKPPSGFLCSWAGSYMNTLDLIHRLHCGSKITHLHYSGGPTGLFTHPIDELLLSSSSPRKRLSILTIAGLKDLTGVNFLSKSFKKARRKLDCYLNRTS